MLRVLSRRALVAGSVAALLTTTVVGSSPAVASHFGPVLLGHDNAAPNWTQLTNTAPAGSGNGTALYLFGSSAAGGDGLYTVSYGGNGVYAYSYAGNGLYAHGSAKGVFGHASAQGASGVHGENDSQGFGVSGRSQGVAVSGESTAGTGVYGHSQNLSGIGVNGESEAPNGTGVIGNAPSAGATGVRALSANGTALSVEGKARFARSGKLTIPAGASSAVKTGVALSSASMVLATLQQNRPGVWIQAAVPSPSAGSFTVHLNKTAPASTTVAWFVLN